MSGSDSQQGSRDLVREIEGLETLTRNFGRDFSSYSNPQRESQASTHGTTTVSRDDAYLVVGKSVPKVGSVMSSIISPVQSRLSASTVEENKRDRFMSPVYLQGGDVSVENEQGQGGDVSVENEQGQGEIMGLRDLNEAGDQARVPSYEEIGHGNPLPTYFGRSSRDLSGAGVNHETEPGYPAGDFRYFSSPRLQEHAEDDIPERFRPGRESLSVRQNITVRGSKRSKTRSLDQEYQRRVSFTPTAAYQVFGFTHNPGPIRNGSPAANESRVSQGNHRGNLGDGITREQHTPSFAGHRGVTPNILDTATLRNGDRSFLSRQPISPDQGGFMINLTFEGNLVRHPVTEHMGVIVVIGAAAAIYNLDAGNIVLVLFGMNPQSLIRGNRLSDPPQVGPNATILVFCRISGLDPSRSCIIFEFPSPL
jgi:hypothetical protein